MPPLQAESSSWYYSSHFHFMRQFLTQVRSSIHKSYNVGNVAQTDEAMRNNGAQIHPTSWPRITPRACATCALLLLLLLLLVDPLSSVTRMNTGEQVSGQGGLGPRGRRIAPLLPQLNSIYYSRPVFLLGKSNMGPGGGGGHVANIGFGAAPGSRSRLAAVEDATFVDAPCMHPFPLAFALTNPHSVQSRLMPLA